MYDCLNYPPPNKYVLLGHFPIHSFVGLGLVSQDPMAMGIGTPYLPSHSTGYDKLVKGSHFWLNADSWERLPIFLPPSNYCPGIYTFLSIVPSEALQICYFCWKHAALSLGTVSEVIPEPHNKICSMTLEALICYE